MAKVVSNDDWVHQDYCLILITSGTLMIKLMLPTNLHGPLSEAGHLYE